MTSDAQIFDVSIALSFILLSDKISAEKVEEMLVGIIVYDMKTRKTMCFNLKSFDRAQPKRTGLFSELAIDLFNKSISPAMECKSYLTLPIYSASYVALPWLQFMGIEGLPTTDSVPQKRQITVPEFFVFGYSALVDNETSFDFVPFSVSTKGSASCILKFLDENRKITYNLRIDRSQGEPLIHVDFAVYDGEQKKLASHYPLDLQALYQLSPELFIAVLASAMYDGNFSTIIEKGIKGVADLTEKNAAYFYPLGKIWIVENAIQWFNEQPKRYDILWKVRNHDELTPEEKVDVEYMRNNFLGVIATQDGRDGTGLMGDAVLFRHDRNLTHLRM
jgi:hypothetical protein